MKDISVSDLKLARQALERELYIVIQKAVSDFRKFTGYQIASINVNFTPAFMMFGERLHILDEVRAKVDLR